MIDDDSDTDWVEPLELKCFLACLAVMILMTQITVVMRDEPLELKCFLACLAVSEIMTMTMMIVMTRWHGKL